MLQKIDRVVIRGKMWLVVMKWMTPTDPSRVILKTLDCKPLCKTSYVQFGVTDYSNPHLHAMGFFV
uniref:Uncharacterized protein n=1 Tax=Arundo donax TaxID=35708 RepID=A0A0A9C6H6_ARUDO